jgi:P-type Ca2+ transporter type 2C
MTYPYTRVEECSWQPEELARHLAVLESSCSTGGGDPIGNGPITHLLSHGWSSRSVPHLRRAFGANVMGEDSVTFDEDPQKRNNRKNLLLKLVPILSPIVSALVEQLQEPLILMLVGSAVLSIVLGNAADAISIGMALLIVSLVAAVQEVRSEQALAALANLVPHACTVLRDGRVLDRFPAKELVVGDLVLLATGDRVPADCRVVDSVELMLDESNLTGENHPVSKTGEGLTSLASAPPHHNNSAPSNHHQHQVPIPQQSNMVFCGTLVNAGRGRALVVAVGKATEFGMVASELSSITTRKSPLQLKIDELSKRLAYLSSAAIAVLAIWGLLMGRPFVETLTVAVSLAVAAIPEGLPICTTVTLALGVLRMSKRNAIVKKLPVVESLGCTTAVCSDKTGTLTQNEMTARAAFTLAFPHTSFGFTGVGYETSSSMTKGGSAKLIISNAHNKKDPKSSFFPPRHLTSQSDEYVALSALLTTGCLCNNATKAFGDILSSPHQQAGRNGSRSGATTTLSGQPTELALLVAAEKSSVPDPRPQYHRLQEIPFSSERKIMEVRARPVSGIHACPAFTKSIIATKSGSTMMNADGSMYFVKGMPEKVLAECMTHVAPDGSPMPLTEDGKTMALTSARRMAATGLRVLAMAYGDDLDRLTFAGIVGIEDPPRDGVQESVRHLREGGVKVIMVTGDAKETALAIARRCGILGNLDNSTPPYHHHHGDYHHDQHLPDSGSASLDDNIGDSERSSSQENFVDGLFLSDVELGASTSMSGAELDAIPPQSLADSIIGVRVFYRVAPRHKLAIVRALQDHGDIVAMTGDGKFRAALIFRLGGS